MEVSRSQNLVVFGLESGLIGILQMQSSNPNWTPSLQEENPIPSDLLSGAKRWKYDYSSQSSEAPKKGFNLQLHETLHDMSITAIKICDTIKCFYVGTSEGIVSCFMYEVRLFLYYFNETKYLII